MERDERASWSTAYFCGDYASVSRLLIPCKCTLGPDLEIHQPMHGDALLFRLSRREILERGPVVVEQESG